MSKLEDPGQEIKHKSEKLRDLLAFSEDLEQYFSKFTNTIVNPIKNYVKTEKYEGKGRANANKTLYDHNPMVWCVFSEFENFQALFEQVSNEIRDNIAPNVVDGPYGKWTNSIPKSIKIFLKVFHAYFVYYLSFCDLRKSQPRFNEFLQGLEKNYGKPIDEYFKEYMGFLDYLKYNIVSFNTNIMSTKNDQKQIQDIIDSIVEAQLEAHASLNDSIPEKFGQYMLEETPSELKYGTLCKATIPNKEDQFYAQIISKTSQRTLEHLKEIEGVVDATLKLVHPNILPVEDYIEDELYWCIVYPFTDNMTITNLLQRTGPLPEEAARTLFRQIMHAIQHIHTNGVVHNHITPNNFIIYQGKLKLFDFCYCNFAKPGEKKANRMPPLAYASPDSLREKYFDGASADIWAAGVILYEMLNGRRLFVGNEAAVRAKILRAALTYPKTFSPTVVSLLKGILTPVSTDRLTSEQILSHPWMKKTLEITIKNILQATPPASENSSSAYSSRLSECPSKAETARSPGAPSRLPSLYQNNPYRSRSARMPR